MEAERNALHEHVYPELKAFCADPERNARFQAIDLRWGVSGEASLDQRAMPICLDEIKRCHEVTPRPNFLVLLGNRYGWLPPPPVIPKDEFEEISQRVPEEQRYLLEWYRLDENAEPDEYRLRPRTDPPRGEKHDGKDYEDTKPGNDWGKVEKELQTVLASAVDGMGLDEERERVYVASATEQEIREGALSRRTADDQAFCLFREITNHPDRAAAADDDPISRFMDLDQGPPPEAREDSPLERLKGDLRDKLPESAINDYEVDWEGDRPGTGHLTRLVEETLELLKAAIDNELRNPLRLEEAPAAPPLFHGDEALEDDPEAQEHRKFAEERARIFEGRDTLLGAIAAYLDDDDPRPLVLYGKGGTGKSALMAKALARAQGRPGELVYRFIGATPDSSSGRELLRSLCLELGRRLGDDAPVPDDYQQLVTDFRERLERAGAARPLALFIDSLDQLSPADGARSLSWLPSPLPAGVRLVVSTRPGDTLEPLERRQARLEEVGPLSPEDGRKILELWLDDADRKLRPTQWGEVLDGFEESERNPLWLRLGFEEARRWRSDQDPPPERLAKGIAPEEGPSEEREESEDVAEAAEGEEPEIEGIIAQNTFPRLIEEDRHGDVLVSRALGYLAASQYGLAEDELLDLLSSDPVVYQWFISHTFHVPPDLQEAAGRYLADRGEEKTPKEVRKWLENIKQDGGSNELDRFLDEILPTGSVSLPVVLWSRLFADLRPYLSERSAEGGALIAFYHRELDEVAHEAFLARKKQEREFHARIADYFRRKADPDQDRSWTGDSVRGLSELPYHLTKSADIDNEDDERWEEVHDTLTDFRFLEEKAAKVGVVTTGSGEDASTTYTGVFQLQDDYALALERMPGGGDGARGGRRQIIVTATDFGEGYVVRCPHCNVLHTFDEDEPCTACQATHNLDDWLGDEIDCPNKSCNGPLKVNEFTVPPRE